MIELKEALSTKEYALGKQLFLAYSNELQVDLSFQNFEEEMEKIDQQYARPYGSLYIAYNQKDLPVGCFGIRKLDQSICELKRMYIQSDYRGYGLGKQFIYKSFEVGRDLGYQKIRLDTLPSMQSAIKLYQKSGFYEIEPYRYNPIKETKFFEKKLI